jgi:predicted N-acyltransferase
VHGDVLVSGYSAPFGGPDFVRESETVTAIMSFLRGVLDAAALQGIKTVRIKAKPSFYSKMEEGVQFALLNLGFAVEACELNFHIDLQGVGSGKEYIDRLKPPARRALAHARLEPFTFGRADTDTDWASSYEVLRRNREAKGRALRLSLEYLLRIRDTFPGKIRMFTLDYEDRRCAAALVYRVCHRRDLVVYWGDADHDLPRSPMNLLVYQLVEHAVDERVLSIDVGISSENGTPNQGLIQFKESVLARARLRLDLVRRL